MYNVQILFVKKKKEVESPCVLGGPFFGKFPVWPLFFSVPWTVFASRAPQESDPHQYQQPQPTRSKGSNTSQDPTFDAKVEFQLWFSLIIWWFFWNCWKVWMLVFVNKKLFCLGFLLKSWKGWCLFVAYPKLSNCGGGFFFNSASVEQAKYSSGLQYWAGAFKSISNSAKAMSPSWHWKHVWHRAKWLRYVQWCQKPHTFHHIKPNSQSSWGRRFPPTQIAGDASPVLLPCCARNCARNCPTVKGPGRAALPSDVMVPRWGGRVFLVHKWLAVYHLMVVTSRVLQCDFAMSIQRKVSPA